MLDHWKIDLLEDPPKNVEPSNFLLNNINYADVIPRILLELGAYKEKLPKIQELRRLDFSNLNLSDNLKLRFLVKEMREKNDAAILAISHANLCEHLRLEQGMVEEQRISSDDKVFHNNSSKRRRFTYSTKVPKSQNATTRKEKKDATESD